MLSCLLLVQGFVGLTLQFKLFAALALQAALLSLASSKGLHCKEEGTSAFRVAR